MAPQAPGASGPPASGVPAAGAVVGKYRVEAPLGGGGMGVVVRATHLRHGGPVALKFLRAAGDPLGPAAARMLREARAAVRVVDEHVMRLHDVDVLDDGSPYLVMELLKGESLAERIARLGRLPWPEACELLAQACEGLEAAHKAGVLHRDLKPSNLFLAVQGERTVVKLVDFGLAKETSAEADATLTREGAMLGSPAYMAPEQIRDARSVDERTDLWALGVTLYEALTGSLPFPTTSILSLTSAIAADPPRDPRQLVPELPPVLVRLTLSCLEKDPRARPQTARDLRDALRRLIDGAPGRAPSRLPARPALGLALLLAAPAGWLALRPPPEPSLAAGAAAPVDRAAASAAASATGGDSGHDGGGALLRAPTSVDPTPATTASAAASATAVATTTAAAASAVATTTAAAASAVATTTAAAASAVAASATAAATAPVRPKGKGGAGVYPEQPYDPRRDARR